MSRAPHPRGCPATGCECGFYALHSLPELNDGLDRAIWEIDTATSGGRHGLVLGVVAGSGRVLIGHRGLACPIRHGSSPCSPARRSRTTPARWGSPRPRTACPVPRPRRDRVRMGTGPGRGRLPDGLRASFVAPIPWRLHLEEARVATSTDQRIPVTLVPGDGIGPEVTECGPADRRGVGSPDRLGGVRSRRRGLQEGPPLGRSRGDDRVPRRGPA